MKRSWIRFLLIVLLLLLPIAATAAVGFLVPAQFKMTFLGEFDNKVERLQNTDGPKVILVGGSSVAFGVDAELLERLLFKVRQPATSGNKNHYIIWATSVDGVGGVKVLPLWNGNGTVKVIITNAENEIASEDLITKVQNYIDEQRPIGATVTVVSPKPLNIDIALKVTKGSGNIDGIKNAVNDFFKTTAFNSEYVSYAQVGKVILEKTATTGVQDYSNLTLNNQTENIVLTDEQLPTVGQVNLIE